MGDASFLLSEKWVGVLLYFDEHGFGYSKVVHERLGLAYSFVYDAVYFLRDAGLLLESNKKGVSSGYNIKGFRISGKGRKVAKRFKEIIEVLK